MRKYILLFLVFNFSIPVFCQKEAVNGMFSNVLSLIQGVENDLDVVNSLLNKSLTKKDTLELRKIAMQLVMIAEKSEINSKQAEQMTDMAEKKSKSVKCFDAAQEADDAEDYCRHLVFQTHEILIYSKKIMSESEIDYIQTYLNKAISYTQEAFESVKNARIELIDGTKDLIDCQ